MGVCSPYAARPQVADREMFARYRDQGENKIRLMEQAHWLKDTPRKPHDRLLLQLTRNALNHVRFVFRQDDRGASVSLFCRDVHKMWRGIRIQVSLIRLCIPGQVKRRLDLRELR